MRKVSEQVRRMAEAEFEVSPADTSKMRFRKGHPHPEFFAKEIEARESTQRHARPALRRGVSKSRGAWASAPAHEPSSLPRDVWRRLNALAKEAGMTLRDFLREALTHA